MNPAAEIARIVAEHRARTRRLREDLDALRRSHAAAEADITVRRPVPAAEPGPDDDDPEDAYYRPASWLV